MKMIKKFYSIFDTKAQHFLNPIEAINHGDAIRMFTTFINGDKEKSNIARYPTQFILYHLFDMDDKTGHVGNYNEAEGKLKPENRPVELIIGSVCVEEQNKTFTINELTALIQNRMDSVNQQSRLTDDEISNMKVL